MKRLAFALLLCSFPLMGQLIVVTGGPGGTPSSLTLTNATGLPNTGLVNSGITIAGSVVALGGSTTAFPSPGAIGGTTPSTGAFTTITATTSFAVGSSPPALTGTGIFGCGENTGQGNVSGADAFECNSSSHQMLLSNNNATAVPVAVTPASTTSGDLASLSGTIGSVLADSGVVAANVNTNSSNFTSGHVVSANGNHTTTDGGAVAANLVVAPSPGAGIAHFAGSTQTVTSSAVSLTVDVTGTLAAGNGGTGITSLGTGVATALGAAVSGSGSICLSSGSACSGGGGSSAGASLFSTTGSTTVTATSATTLIGSVTGSTTIGANVFTAGQALVVFAEGYYTTPATPASLTITLNVGGTIRLTTGAVVQIASVTNGTWRLNCMLTTRTTGSSGTQIGNCIFEGTGATLTPGEAAMQVSSAWTIDTTATQAMDVQATWSTATGSPTITSTNIAAWIPGAPVTSIFGQTGAVGNLTGDATTSGSPAVVVAKINGVAFSGTAGDAVKFGAGTPGITPVDSGLAMPSASGSATVTQTVANGTAALGTSSISTGACATVVTVAGTGIASTDVIEWAPNASIKAVTGYAPSTSGGLSIAAYPTSGNVNFDVCNWTSGSITPGAVTLNWAVHR